MASVNFLKGSEQALGAHAALVLSHHCLIKLECESRAWHGQVHPLALIENDAEVFDEVLDVEAGVEVSLEHAWTQLLHREATSGTLSEHRDHLVMVKVGLLGVEK